jgi:energy-coupling factor transporter ATP-binding protein EcfA2
VTTLVYVHGTNGSGKSTLARAVLAAAGGALTYSPRIVRGKKTRQGYTPTTAGVVLLGKYSGRQCGGVDLIAPYRLVREEIQIQSVSTNARVFAEGLITPGVETCAGFAELFDRAVFVYLDTPAEQCVANMLKRKARIDRTGPYDPKNLYKKIVSASNWADRLERAGLEVQRLQYHQAYNMTLELLGLPEPSVDDLL